MTKYKGMGQTDQDIIRAIGYITDAKYIASYFGVDLKRVIALREKVQQDNAKPLSIEDQEFEFRPQVSALHWSNDAERKWNANAREGSAALLAALEKFFEKRILQKQIEQRGGTDDPS